MESEEVSEKQSEEVSEKQSEELSVNELELLLEMMSEGTLCMILL